MVDTSNAAGQETDPMCDICKKPHNGEYVYHNGGMVIGTLIVCKACDEAYKAKKAAEKK